MLRFLEREGYDVTYATSVDTDRDPSLLLSHKAFFSVGHDEYWSKAMRDNVERARGLGINLGFISSNVSYWQIRYEPSTVTGSAYRTIVCYKSTADPLFNDGNSADQQLVTVEWRQPPVSQPENSMVGVMYSNVTYGTFDMVVANPSSWVFSNTGLKNGDHLAGLLGYEADSIFPGSPAGLVDLAHSPFMPGQTLMFSDMTVYSSGASTIVASGSMHFNWAMDQTMFYPDVTNPAVQQVLRNILARFGVHGSVG
jgi:hypothetical protein